MIKDENNLPKIEASTDPHIALRLHLEINPGTRKMFEMLTTPQQNMRMKKSYDSVMLLQRDKRRKYKSFITVV